MISRRYAHGWVDGRAIRQMYADMIQLYRRGDDAYIAFTGPLWTVVALELWLDAANVPSVDPNAGSAP